MSDLLARRGAGSCDAECELVLFLFLRVWGCARPFSIID